MKQTAFERAVAIANGAYDGHFVLMKFTTNWRFCFGTPVLDQQGVAYETSEGATMDEAIEHEIKKQTAQIRKDCKNTRSRLRGIEGILGELTGQHGAREPELDTRLDASSVGKAIEDVVKHYGEDTPC